jgi:hypothetical protein
MYLGCRFYPFVYVEFSRIPLKKLAYIYSHVPSTVKLGLDVPWGPSSKPPSGARAGTVAGGVGPPSRSRSRPTMASWCRQKPYDAGSTRWAGGGNGLSWWPKMTPHTGSSGRSDPISARKLTSPGGDGLCRCTRYTLAAEGRRGLDAARHAGRDHDARHKRETLSRWGAPSCAWHIALSSRSAQK